MAARAGPGMSSAAQATPMGVMPVPYTAVGLAPACSSASTTSTWPNPVAMVRSGILRTAVFVKETGTLTHAPALARARTNPACPLPQATASGDLMSPGRELGFPP